jgi:hypothetical protein
MSVIMKQGIYEGNVQLMGGFHFAHGLCAFANDFIKNRQCIFVIITDGNGAAQKKAF